MYKIFILLVLYFVFFDAFGQEFNISGTVKDASNRTTLPGASVYIYENLNGVATDANGHYSFNEKAGKYTLICSFIGYDTVRQDIILNNNLIIDLNLNTSTIMVKGIEVSVKREDRNVRSAEISTIELPMKRIEKIPVMFGEKDILKTIQLLPGIQAGGEGSNTFFVRGGGSDQNLILIDGSTVYNPSHAAGFFSVFNADIINSAEIIKGGMSPEYGGRMSSVLNISTLDGDKLNYKGQIGIGLLSSHLQVEGPIQKNKSSFSLAGRRTYADFIMQPFMRNSKSFSGLNYYFYDLNAKLSFQLSKKDNLFITGYYGKDLFKFDKKEQNYYLYMNWKNAVASVRWNHIFNKRLYFDIIGSFSNYNLKFKGNEKVMSIAYKSSIRNFTTKGNLTYTPDSLHKIKTGISHTYYIFAPSNIGSSSNETYFKVGIPMKLYSEDFVAYLQHDWHITDNLELLYGLRYTYYRQIGPFTRYKIDNIFNLNNIDSTLYGKNKTVAAYNLFEPRCNVRYKLTNNKSLKASYTLTRQYLNLAALMDISLPTDIWLPSSEFIKPQLTHQFSAGYFQNFLQNTMETSIEVYYKRMHYMLDINPEVNLVNIFKTNLDYGYIEGDGQSYGIELFINKTSGKFTGWIGYTLSWTTRNFDKIMNGKTFYARYDRRHDISILLNYELNKKWDFSIVWVFSSGNAATIPNSFYIINGNLYIEYGEHNAWRMPDYHRLDLSATWNIINKKHFIGNLNFSIYNTYNRKNPYIISYSVTENTDKTKLNVKAFQISIFPVLPSISFTMQFK